MAEGTGRSELTDVVCAMYPDVPRMIRLSNRLDEDRPVILCEYSHAMGNSNGNLHLYWRAIWDPSLPRLQGACIWDYVDQGLRIPDSRSSGGYYFGYGGDFGDTVNDAQFCINGMFTPDREPHPAVAEIKYLQQPVFFFSTTDAAGSAVRVLVTGDSKPSVVLKARNRYSFCNLSHLGWSWDLVSNRSDQPIRSGHFEIRDEAQEEEEVVINLESVVSRVRKLEKTKPRFGNVFFLNLRGYLRCENSWADIGHVLVRQQFEIIFDFEELWTPVPSPTRQARKLRIKATSDDDVIQIFRVSESESGPFAVIDKQSGALIQYSPKGRNLLSKGILPNFVRAATDNDKGGLELVLAFFMLPSSLQSIVGLVRGLKDFSNFSRWQMAGLDYPPKITCVRTRITDSGENEAIGIVALCTVTSQRSEKELFHVKLHYVIFPDGRICITHHVSPRPFLKKATSSLPRVGMNMQLDASLCNISYYGRGPNENYPDRKSGSEMGVYNTTPTEMAYNKYIVPGENGSRSDCEHCAFRSDDGDGFVVVQRTPDGNLSSFSCSALLHSITELHEASHTCDLEPRENGEHPVHVNIDHELMGVGGDNRYVHRRTPSLLSINTTSF